MRRRREGKEGERGIERGGEEWNLISVVDVSARRIREHFLDCDQSGRVVWRVLDSCPEPLLVLGAIVRRGGTKGVVI
jgi:hypothetical protein